MHTLYKILISIILLSQSNFSYCQQKDCKELKLISSIPFSTNTLNNLSPSGLTIRNDTLFYVCDYNTDIFSWKIDIKAKKIEPASYVDLLYCPKFNKNYNSRSEHEGITLNDKSEFFVSTERDDNYVFKVIPGSRSDTFTFSLSKELINHINSDNKLQKNNFLEGISIYPNDKIVVGYERTPCGLRIFDNKVEGSNKLYSLVENVNIPCHKFDGAGEDDLSGLFYYSNLLYAVNRKAKTVILYEFSNNSFSPVQYLYYGSSIKYDSSFGQAEGIAVDKNHIYIITDNYTGSRKKHLLSKYNQYAPRLFIFKHP